MNKSINWFPGHMKKTYDVLESNKKKFDFIIQVLDARAISFSSNNELITFFGDKKIINVALKSDLADLIYDDSQKNILIFGKNSVNINKLLISRIKQSFGDQLSFYSPIHTGIVVGLPNIGKSTLINKLANTKKAEVMNKPGTTRSLTLQKISNNLFLYDSPGVMYKKIDNLVTGYVLCLLGTINPHVISLNDLMRFALKFLQTYYHDLYKNLIEIDLDTYDDQILFLCKKWNLFLKNGEPNQELTLNKLYNLFTTGKIGKISYDNKNLGALITED